MNRFGWLLLGLFVLAAIAVGTMVRFVPDMPEAPPTVEKPRMEPGVTPSGLVIPVQGIRPEELIDTFGQTRGGGTRPHGALDIMAARGTPVLAAAGGTVEKLFESEAGGHTVYVRSPDKRWVYYYAHLDAYAPDLREGMAVARGRAIGTVGSTGNADPAGPHLHFEIKRMGAGEKWYQGRGINPYPLLAGTGLSR
jgi:murein DD-endopeptidase MepM/ murein hydrolase activator NlpD